MNLSDKIAALYEKKGHSVPTGLKIGIPGTIFQLSFRNKDDLRISHKGRSWLVEGHDPKCKDHLSCVLDDAIAGKFNKLTGEPDAGDVKEFSLTGAFIRAKNEPVRNKEKAQQIFSSLGRQIERAYRYNCL